MRDYGLSTAQQDEIWRRWREGQSFSLIGRALGAPMQNAHRFLRQFVLPEQVTEHRQHRQPVSDPLSPCEKQLRFAEHLSLPFCHRRSGAARIAVAGQPAQMPGRAGPGLRPAGTAAPPPRRSSR